MKRLLTIFLVLSFLLVPVFGYSGEKQIRFAWEQVLSSDMAGWRLYRSGVSAGPYTEVLDIPYAESDSGTYTSDFEMASPDGKIHTYYFVLRAYDTSGNESADSNEVDLVVDFEAPSSPFNLVVTIIAGG